MTGREKTCSVAESKVQDMNEDDFLMELKDGTGLSQNRRNVGLEGTMIGYLVQSLALSSKPDSPDEEPEVARRVHWKVGEHATESKECEGRLEKEL